MQITYKRNGIKNYLIVKNERYDVPSLREKMIVRNDIPYLAKMTPQNIDGYSYYYYDIQGRVNLETIFSGRNMTKDEISAILQGLSGLLSELARYLLSPDEVLYAPSDIWLLPDTLEPAFIYVPDMPQDELHSLRYLADFLTDHVDGNDREAAKLAYEYLEMVENGCILPKPVCETRSLNDQPESHEFPLPERNPDPLTDPNEYWELKEGISDEMKPFFAEDDNTGNNSSKKKTAYILLGLVISLASAYIVMVMAPSLFPITLTDEEYLVSGIVIAFAFAVVLISVSLQLKKKDKDTAPGDNLPEEDIAVPKPETGDNIEYMEYQDHTQNEEYEKTVLIKSPLSLPKSPAPPELRYEDGRKISISVFPFIIGKMKSRVDGVVDGTGISRIHAMIKEQDGKYFLSDLNSLNGTGVNGKMLDANETAEILDGDIISLANTSLTFHTKAG